MENKQSGYEGFDRRLFPRLDISTSVEYSVLRILPIKEKVSSKDISAGGIRFVATEDLKMNTMLSLTIHLPDGSAPVKAKGKVVRKIGTVALPGQKTGYEVGVEFKSIREKDQERIAKYVLGSNG